MLTIFHEKNTVSMREKIEKLVMKLFKPECVLNCNQNIGGVNLKSIMHHYLSFEKPSDG